MVVQATRLPVLNPESYRMRAPLIRPVPCVLILFFLYPGGANFAYLICINQKRTDFVYFSLRYILRCITKRHNKQHERGNRLSTARTGLDRGP